MLTDFFAGFKKFVDDRPITTTYLIALAVLAEGVGIVTDSYGYLLIVYGIGGIVICIAKIIEFVTRP